MPDTPAPAPLPSAPRRGVRILIVEDHQDTANILCRLLKHLGYDALSAGTVAGAMRAVQSGNFDLLISDISLPDGSGLELLRKLRSTSDIRAISLSGHTGAAELAESRSAGFDRQMIKPVDVGKLAGAIKELVGSRPDQCH
jgi:DNA-binding response OmpR family regulator